MLYYPYAHKISKDLLEIVDAHDRPFLLLNHKQARTLPHRTVVLLAQDTMGKMLMWRNFREKSKKWDFLYGYVRAGEARENTMLRLIERHIPPLFQLMHHKDYAHILENAQCIYGDERAQNSKKNSKDIANALHHASLTRPKLENTALFLLDLRETEKALLGKDLLWLDFDELQGFAKHFSDMLGSKTQELLTLDYLQKVHT